MAGAIKQAAQRRPTAALQLTHWERAFRADFAQDAGAGFQSLIQRFGMPGDAQAMLEGSIDFVRACAAYAQLNGSACNTLLADQRYRSPPDGATYALTFDIAGRGSARVLVRADLQTIDLADLFNHPWSRLRLAGYSEFWVSRVDGADLSPQELEDLDRIISNDIEFDYGEDEVLISFDPDSCAGALAVRVYEAPDDAFDDEVPNV